MQIEVFVIHKYLFWFQTFQEIHKHKQDHMILMILEHQIPKKWSNKWINGQTVFVSRFVSNHYVE